MILLVKVLVKVSLSDENITDRVLRKSVEVHCRPAWRFHQGCVA